MGQFSGALKPDYVIPFKLSKKDAVEALVTLGYSSTEALKAVNQIEDLSDMDSEAILKAALKYIF